MDVIVSAVGEFVWAASCAVINCCVSSGFKPTAVFVSFLCVILASAFYSYSTSREQMSADNLPYVPHEDEKESASTTELTLITIDDVDQSDNVQSLSEIDVRVEDSASEAEADASDEQTSDGMLMDTIEGSEEEIQKQQIANIYRLLNDQHLINSWTTTDFLDQLKMYGLEAYEEDESESS